MRWSIILFAALSLAGCNKKPDSKPQEAPAKAAIETAHETQASGKAPAEPQAETQAGPESLARGFLRDLAGRIGMGKGPSGAVLDRS